MPCAHQRRLQPTAAWSAAQSGSGCWCSHALRQPGRTGGERPGQQPTPLPAPFSWLCKRRQAAVTQDVSEAALRLPLEMCRKLRCSCHSRCVRSCAAAMSHKWRDINQGSGHPAISSAPQDCLSVAPAGPAMRLESLPLPEPPGHARNHVKFPLPTRCLIQVYKLEGRRRP